MESVAQDVSKALAEDIGSGDVTSSLILDDARTSASVISRESAIICGRPWFDAVFKQLDTNMEIEWHVQEGQKCRANQLVCTLVGHTRAILTGERTALNFLQTLSGTATRAWQYSQQVKETDVKVLDTRKTIPGLRQAQKYAVRTGGCHNHRVGLFDAVLIKENHIMAAGSISQAVKHFAGHLASQALLIEVEVEELDQIEEAIVAGADRLLLDNMGIEKCQQAVHLVDGRVELEASGNINLDNIYQYAQTGVDFISIGELTKHVRATDLSLLVRL